MKKVFLILVMAVFSSMAFAGETKELREEKTVPENKIVKESVKSISLDNKVSLIKVSKKFPQGSGTIIDGCGNEIEVVWSCNYNCGTLAVINALIAFGDDNTDCGFGSYIAD